MSSDWAIRVTGLSKHYHIYEKPQHRLLQGLFRGRRQYFRNFAALDQVTFEISRGETVGIIGLNGSGKSTLLQLICGTLTPTHGTVQVNGRIAALLELGAGFNPEFTGLENVYLNAAIMGLSRDQVNERLDQILAFADIGEFVHQPVKTYSSGMFVRLAFAVVAHVDADILVIDEALAVGDAFFTQKCMRFLRTFRERGTILFVSHDNGSIVNLCQRAVWLDQGTIQAIGEAKVVSELYLKSHYEAEQGVAEHTLQSPAPTEGESVAPPGGAFGAIANVEQMPPSTSFGKQGALVIKVQLLDESGEQIVMIRGGEAVRLMVEAESRQIICAPLVGFHVKDRLGQLLFGDNTSQVAEISGMRIPANQLFRAEFRFAMPYLSAGDYTITAAVGEGSQQEHVIHHWIHDALAFRSQSHVMHGLFAVPTNKSVFI